MTLPHSGIPSQKFKRSASSLWAKFTILLQKISDGTYLPNWAPPHPFKMNSNLTSPNTTYQFYQSWIQRAVRMANVSPNVLWWLVFPGVPCAQSASLHPAAQLFPQPPTTSPTLVHWYLKEGMPVCFSWHKHKVPLGSFLDPLHTAYHGATKALPADCIKCKGRLWAKSGKRPAADSGAFGI